MDGRGNIASRSLTGGTRLLEYTLAVCVFLGSFALWVVAPFGSLYPPEAPSAIPVPSFLAQITSSVVNTVLSGP